MSSRRARRFAESLFLIGAAAAVGGCSKHWGAAAGPLVAMAGEDERPSGGVSVEVGQGQGQAREDGRGAAFVDTRARLAVTAPRQQIALMVGPSAVSWHGARTPLWYGLGLGPGVERTRDNGFFEAVAQVRLGSGFVLDESRERDPWPDIDPWTPPHMRRGLLPRPPRELRKRSVLTVGVSADVDARFTRSPLFMMALTIGITSFDELIRPAEPRPPPW